MEVWSGCWDLVLNILYASGAGIDAKSSLVKSFCKIYITQPLHTVSREPGVSCLSLTAEFNANESSENEPGFTGDIGAIEIWLIDWLKMIQSTEVLNMPYHSYCINKEEN